MTCKKCRAEAVPGKRMCAGHLQWASGINVRRVQRNKERAVAHMGSACQDCGLKTTRYEVYDFDHVGVKAANVATLLVNAKWDRIESELALCEMVCANCHRTRTRNRSAARTKHRWQIRSVA